MSDHENEPVKDEEMQQPAAEPAAPATASNEPTNEPTADAPGARAADAEAATIDWGDASAPRGDAQVFNDMLADATWTDGEMIRLAGNVAKATYGPDDKPPYDVTAMVVDKYEKKGYTIFHDNFAKYMDVERFEGTTRKFRVWYVPGSVAQRKKENIFAGGSEFKPKSLFIALTFVNPFFECREDGVPLPPGSPKKEGEDEDDKPKYKAPHVSEEGDLVGYPASEYSPATNFKDDDFLKQKGLISASGVPNNFQKMIEMLIRMKNRSITVLPPDVLVETSTPLNPEMPWNHFAGHSLDESKMFKSPDHDEAYFQVHAQRNTLLDFAAHQGLTLQTNKYSFGGGGGMIYNKELDVELTKSVQDYMKHFEIPEEDHYCRGKLKDLDPEDEPELGSDGKIDEADRDSVSTRPNTVMVDGKVREFLGWGYCVEVPQKQRLLLRLLREGYQFGGTGLQLDEMKEQGDFLKNYFVMHNKNYQKAYDLDQWGSFSALCCNPCMWAQDWEQAITHYYGESVSLYFSWMRRYVAFLSVPAVVGLACGIAQQFSDVPAAVGGGFACFMSIWAILWLRSWQRHEQRFTMRWGQQIETQTELARDEYEPDDKRHVNVERIFSLDFEYPLTMQRLPDGTMVELYYPSAKRNCIRYGFSYPLLLLLACAMAAALFFIEWYRLSDKYKNDNKVAIGASILSVITITVFNKISAVLIDLLNDFENPRTNQECDDELIMKSFAFTFISTYFSVGVILLWPGVPNDVRMTQLKTQMVVQQCLMPFVGNLTELILPKFMTSLQRRVDVTGGYCTALCSYLCCCSCCDCCTACAYDGKKAMAKNEREEAGIELWKQAQKATYVSTAADYLEVVLVYGYMMIFASVFPWAGLANFINQIIEIRVDAYKLNAEHQRPVARTTTGIGAFNDIQFILLGLSLVTNAYIVTLIADGPKQVGMVHDQTHLLEYFSWLQYFLVLAVLVLGLMRGPISPSVKKMQVKLGMLGDRATQQFVQKQLAMSPKALKKAGEDAEREINKTEAEKCCGCC